MAGGSFSGQTVVWTMSGFDVLHVFNGHDDAVNAVAFSPDGQRVLSAGNDHTLRIFSVDHGQQIATFDLEQELVVIRCVLCNSGVDGAESVWCPSRCARTSRLQCSFVSSTRSYYGTHADFVCTTIDLGLHFIFWFLSFFRIFVTRVVLIFSPRTVFKCYSDIFTNMSRVWYRVTGGD